MQNMRKRKIKPKPNIDVAIRRDSKDWDLITDEHIIGVISVALNRFGDHFEVSIVLSNDQFVKSLNKQYRFKDKPTNVLSFPAGDETMLGDIVLAFETIQKEADSQDKNFQDHCSHLIVHGTLHLLGYDHIEEDEAEEMENLEIEILSELEINNPYIMIEDI